MVKRIIYSILILFLLVFIFLIFPQKFPKDKINNKIDQTIQKIEEVKETIAPQPTRILESGLPNKHLIKAAFMSQAPEKNWDQPWQDACEEASLILVDFFYKNQKEISINEAKNAILKMLEFEETLGFTKDMTNFEMEKVAIQYLGYKTKIIDNPQIEDIKRIISQDIPIIVTANGKILYLENRHFNSNGPYYHSLVILGYDDDKKQFIVHDIGTQFGSYYKYSYDLLMDSIHDFPESGKKEDINDGQKRLLILLK